MTWEIRFSRRARRELTLIRVWWRLNRPSAIDLLDEELDATRDLLAQNPGAGVAARDSGIAQVQRVLMRRTGYLLFYRVDEAAGRIEVLAIWHAKRRPPRL